MVKYRDDTGRDIYTLRMKLVVHRLQCKWVRLIEHTSARFSLLSNREINPRGLDHAF